MQEMAFKIPLENGEHLKGVKKGRASWGARWHEKWDRAKELQMYKSQPVLRAVNSYGVTARYEALPMKPDRRKTRIWSLLLSNSG